MPYKNVVVSRFMKDFVASLKYIKGSAYKMNDVARLIRGLAVEDAKLQLAFCERRLSVALSKLLDSAVANAGNGSVGGKGLFVKRVDVGKAFSLKRSMPRGRGRSSRIEKKFSNVRIVLAKKVAAGV